MRILGIETSCDETSAAVVADGRRILSNVVSSQGASHAPFGGVVPEIASRQHLVHLGPVVRQALAEAEASVSDLEAVAVTKGPGLIGALLAGVSFAKAFAFVRGLPLVGVDHLEGHIRACYLESGEIPHPALALVVSGGHTSLFLIESEGEYRLLGKTRDDAAGEAYDKLSKRLGLGYPGGPVLDRLARRAQERRGDPRRRRFSLPHFSDGARLDFSFSGLKTQVLRAIEQRGMEPLRPGEDPETREDIGDLAAGFQSAVVRALARSVERALEAVEAKAVLLSGGVAANSALRERFRALGEARGLPVFTPSVALSTDNAAMIAAAGWLAFRRGETADAELTANTELRLGESGSRRSSRHR